MDHFDDIDFVRENYRKMQISAEHLQSLINDVLQMNLKIVLQEPLMQFLWI